MQTEHRPSARWKRRWIALVILGGFFVAQRLWLRGTESGLSGLIVSLVGETRYAPGYSESKFRALELGITEAEVLSQLGAPLDKRAARPRIDWLYVDGPWPAFAREGEAPGHRSYTRVNFDSDGRLVDCWGQLASGVSAGSATIHPDFPPLRGRNRLGLDDRTLQALVAAGTTTEQFAARYGPPTEVYATQAVAWLDYANSPSSTHHHVRRIGIDAEGRVVSKLATVYWD